MTGSDEKDPSEAPWLTVERLGAITDGVVAIIVTILVLGIEVPKGHDFDSEGIISFLWKVERPIFIYLISFFLVWAYWLQHHVIFHYVIRTDRALVYFRLGNLIFVTIPLYYLSHPAADTHWRSEE